MDNYIGVDCETEEFNADKGITARTAKMIGMSVAYDDQWATYETDPEKWKIPPGVPVFHHAKFDLSKFKKAGVPTPEKWEDTLIASHLINENIPNHKLKSLAKSLLNKEVTLYTDVDSSDPAAFSEYAKNDARYTYSLWHRFQHELDYQNLNRVYDLEKNLVPVIQSMEDAGMLIDQEELASFNVLVKTTLEERKEALFKLAGQEFEVDSPKQTAEFLYDTLGLKCRKFTAKKAPSVNEAALIALYNPISDAILAYRETRTLYNNFSNKLHKFIEEDGRIRASFNPLGPVTGRLSCSDPNIQQCPSKSELGRKFRRCFVAPKGSKLLVADYSQMELRVLAHFSGDPLLISAYQNGLDLHTETAKMVFNTSTPTKDQRTLAKIVNFGIVYGLTPVGLYRRLPLFGVHNVSLKECEEFISRYFQTYKGVRTFLGIVEKVLKRRGYVKTLWGRRRRLQGINDREVRQAQNFIIQGTSADMCKQAMIDIHRELPKGARIIAMIHDELIVECPDELVVESQKVIEHYMSQTPENFKVTMGADIKVVNRWGEK